METRPESFEFKKNNMFMVEFPENFCIKPWSIQTINKPKYTNGEWEDIKISFIDPIGPSTSQSLFNIVNFLKDNKYKHDCDYLFEIKIKTLDTTYACVELWTINVEKVLTINFGDLKYGNDGLQKPYLIVKPFDCTLNY